MRSNNKYISRVLELLEKSYPQAKIALKYKSPWEILVAVVLSAQCTDIMVNKVTQSLFSKYLTLEDYVDANLSEFAEDIRSTGFYRNKAKNIIATAKIVKEKFQGHVPDRINDLIELPGVARKTANVILSNAFNKNEGIAVDTHVLRISQRLRLVDLSTIGGKVKVFLPNQNMFGHLDYLKDADPVKIEKQLMKVIDKKYWHNLTYWIIDHGRAVCKAQKPACSKCTLKNICPAFR